MQSQGIVSGDAVVALAGLVVSSAVASGAIAAPCVVWRVTRKLWISLSSILAGAVVGFGVGTLAGWILYGMDGNTRVVKVGAASLGATIPAGIAGGLAASFTVVWIAALLGRPRPEPRLLFGIAVPIGIAVGLLLACLGSLA